MLLNCGAGEDSWESLEHQGNQTGPSQRKSVLNIHWKDWCGSSNPLATWCEELAYWKRPWCWERLKAKGEGGSRVKQNHQLNGHEFEQTPRDGEGQGSLACCSQWGQKKIRHDWVTEPERPSLWSNSHNCTRLLENHCFDYMDFVSKVMPLLFSTLSRFVTAFLPKSKYLLISWLQSPP